MLPQYMDETRRVARSMIVLLAALLLVYVIFFDVHGDSMLTDTEDTLEAISPNNQMLYVDTTQTSRNAGSDDIYYVENDVIERNKQQLVQAQNAEKIPTVIETPTTTQPVSLPDVVEDFEGRRFYSTDFLFDRQQDTTLIGSKANPVVDQPVSITSFGGESAVPSNQDSESIVSDTAEDMLKRDDTWVREKTLDLMVRLDLDDDVEYILKDMNNTHYIYLGNFDGSLDEIVGFLGGTSIDISGKIGIFDNHLFGKKVISITLPDYKRNLKNLFLVTFENGDTRFLQIDKDWYEVVENKILLEKKFGMIYR